MLISLEGLPGTGKTTQGRLLADRLTRTGHRVAYLPDLITLRTDPLGDMLASLFAFTGDPFMRHGDVITETYLAAAIRTNIVATRIQPELATHDILIEDRGIHTMYSYSLATLMQHHTSDATAATAWLTTIGTMTGRQADHALLLRVPLNVALARAARRAGRPFTREQQTYLRYVERAYDELARRDPRMIELDVGSLSRQDAHERLYRTVQALPELPEPRASMDDRATS